MRLEAVERCLACEADAVGTTPEVALPLIAEC
jgi:hypothetical protein